METVVLLSRKKPDGHINVKVEFGEGEGKVPLDNIAKRAEEYKPKERVTYKMISVLFFVNFMMIWLNFLPIISSISFFK